MKTDLTDTTFLMLVRIDSIKRLENILCVTDLLCKYFNTHIIIREADSYENKILKTCLNKKVKYEFIKDKDPVLYLTSHHNQMLTSVETPYIAMWDADIVPDKNAIVKCVEYLRTKKADITYPYDGKCYDVPASIRSLFFSQKNIRFLFRHINKMDSLYPYILVGGAVIMNKEKFIQAGADNEKHYGWGNEDFDRYYRFETLDYKIFRINTPLFHLSHPRGENSDYQSNLYFNISRSEIKKYILDKMDTGS